ALAIWWLVVFGTYKSVEKWFLVACLVYLAYPLSGFMARPDWSHTLRAAATPVLPPDYAGVVMIVGIVGTTIAPWMQFYLQSSVVEKEVPIADYGKARLDVVLGSVVAVVV